MDVTDCTGLHVAAVCGSPSEQSSSGRLLDALLENFSCDTATCTRLDLAQCRADDLLGRARSAHMRAAIDDLLNADIVAVATPVYQASYSGLLKIFFDLLPRHALTGKVAIAVATGGSMAHQLMLEHALRPLLVSAGALVVPTLTYACTPQVTPSIDVVLRSRLARASQEAVALARARSGETMAISGF